MKEKLAECAVATIAYFFMGAAIMLGMIVVKWVIPEPPIEIHETVTVVPGEGMDQGYGGNGGVSSEVSAAILENYASD